MTKYEPKMGESIEIVHERKHRHRIDYITLALGTLATLVVVLIIVLRVPVDPQKEHYLSIILAFGLAASSAGFAGSLNVRFNGSRLVAQGTLAFGIFLFVLAVSIIHRGFC